VAALVGVSGCATATGKIAEHEDEEHEEHAGHGHHSPLPQVSPERAARVKVLESESAGQPTEVLGIVDVHLESGQQDRALQELRIRAAALDADAVVGVEFHHGENAGEATHLSGTAVRFRDLIQGRQYDVVSDLEVHAEMGHEEEALHALQARARDVNADLIVGVHFEHGEGGDGPLKLTGKAIQFRSRMGTR
jgi:uncharacterized protein YbjQ (UPF0145 family)